MGKIKVTKVKSTIEKDKRQKKTMEALGLGKIGSSAVLENSASIEGMIKKVQHLVKVENL